MNVIETNDITLNYVRTLRHWRYNWENMKNEIMELGLDEKFWRKFQMYFLYCEVGFQIKHINNYQIAFKKEASHQTQNEKSYITWDPLTHVSFFIKFKYLIKNN